MVYTDGGLRSKIVYGSIFFIDDTEVSDKEKELRNNEMATTENDRLQTVECVYIEGILHNCSKVKAVWIEPSSAIINYNKEDDEGESIEVSRLLRINHSSLEWNLGKKENGGLQRFAKYKPSIMNQRIPSEEIFVMINESQKDQKDEIIRARVVETIRKLPIPIQEAWLEDIVEKVTITKCMKTNESDSRELYRVSLPSEGDFEDAIVTAYKKELWLKYHKTIPKINSVIKGIFLIESFNLKDWMIFIKKFGRDKFIEYSELNQLGIVALVELVGSNIANKAIDIYGPSIWHSIETKSFFMRIRERNLIPKRDIPNIEKTIQETEENLEKDPENKLFIQELNEEKFKLVIAKERLAKTLEVNISEQIEMIKQSIKVSYSIDSKKSSNTRLVKASIENSDRLVKYFKKEGIPLKNVTRKILKKALLDLSYENVVNSEVASVCARATVSQAEFEVYQKIWDERKENREKSPTRIPTLSGTVGNLNWEMLDQRDENILVAGNETHCCQHPLGLGGACIYYMLDNPETSTIFKISKKGNKKTHAQSFTWVDQENNILCFDNIEVNGNLMKDEILECYFDYVEKTKKTVFHFDSYTIGTGYSDLSLEKLSFASGSKKAKIPFSLGYSDASIQKLIC